MTDSKREVAEQRGERPIALHAHSFELCHPGDAQQKRWLLMFDDRDREADTTTFNDELDAYRVFNNAEGRGWNCHLFVSAPRDPAKADRELATLRAQLATANENIEQLHDGLNEYARACEEAERQLAASEARVRELGAENKRLDSLINNPHTEHFLEAVQLEAAHQQERWGSDHDAGKEDADWFWLIGYLAGKAIRPGQSQEKRLHHIITTAAACLNWHAHASSTHTGPTMRPGLSGEKQQSIDAALSQSSGGEGV